MIYHEKQNNEPLSRNTIPRDEDKNCIYLDNNYLLSSLLHIFHSYMIAETFTRFVVILLCFGQIIVFDEFI